MVDRVDDSPPKGRIAKLIERFRGAAEEDGPAAGGHTSAAMMIQKVAQKPQSLSAGTVKSIAHAIQKSLDQAHEAAFTMDAKNELAIHQAVETQRAAFLQMVSTINPPQEILDSAEFQQLLELLQPTAVKYDQSSFSRGSAMKGKVKSEIQNQKIADAIEKASKEIAGRIKGKPEMNASLNQFAHMSLMQMARLLRKKLKKKKGKQVDENGEVIAGESVDDVELRELMELFCSRALDTMKHLRSEIAPKWAPEQQPWLLQEADKQVFDILLAVIPEELFKETAAYQQIQDLRAGQAVFTLRAADKLLEGTARKR
jgi:hypothetical protein